MSESCRLKKLLIHPGLLIEVILWSSCLRHALDVSQSSPVRPSSPSSLMFAVANNSRIAANSMRVGVTTPTPNLSSDAARMLIIFCSILGAGERSVGLQLPHNIKCTSSGIAIQDRLFAAALHAADLCPPPLLSLSHLSQKVSAGHKTFATCRPPLTVMIFYDLYSG